MKFFDTRARALGLGMLGVIYLLLFIFSTYTIRLSGLYPYWGIGLGVLLMLVGCAFHLGSKSTSPAKWVTISLNAVGTGAIAQDYYRATESELPLSEIWLPLLVAASIIALSAIVFQLIPSGWYMALLFGLISLTLFVLSIIYWVRDGSVIFSLGTMAMAIALIYIVVCLFSLGDNEGSVLGSFSAGSFGILAVVGAIVVLALMLVGGADGCDCDCSGCDCGDCGCGKDNKRKKDIV